MITIVDFVRHAEHRRVIASDLGQWIGLVDADGMPMMDLPPAMILKAPSPRSTAASMELSIPVYGRQFGGVHPAVSALIADNLGRVDEVGRLVPLADQTRFVAIERPDSPRKTFWVAFTIAKGPARAPTQLAIHAVDLRKYLNRFPLISMPHTWKNQFTRFTRDWAGPETVRDLFEKPRDLADMKMYTGAVKSTISGPAVTVIRRAIRESLEAAYRVAGITAPYPIQLTPQPSGADTSRRLFLRREDKPLWDSIEAPALYAGVVIDVGMWWPHDPPVPGLTLTQPTIVIDVKAKEVP